MLKNLEAEQVLLGIILNSNDSIAKVSFLKAEDFAETLHVEIYRTLLQNFLTGTDSNPITLKGHFKPDDYLLQLNARGAGAVNILSYANKVKDLADKRRIKKILESKLGEIDNPDILTNDIIEGFNRDASDMQANTSQYRITTFESVLSEIQYDCENYNKIRITPTGFSRIDKTMNGGFQAGKSYCISARPKDGKTMLKGSIANNLRKASVPFLFIAAEMGRKEITKRLVGADLNIGFSSMNKGNIAYARYLTTEQAKKSNMFFVDAPRITLDALRSVVANAVKTRKIQGFILDYLQLVTGKDPKETIAQHQENVAQTIAEICKKENIWCLYSCQINREGEVRNGDGILMAVDWLYEICAKDYTVGENIIKRAYLKHIATRNFQAADIGEEGFEAFELSINGTHFYQTGEAA